MTRRRWIADEFDQQRAAITGEHAAHLARVLRARVGQEFDIALGDRVRLGRVVAVSDERVEFELAEEIPAARNVAEVTTLLAVIKFDRFEWAVEKLTELGVARIVPLLAARTDAHLASAAAKRAQRWRRVAHEAAEQSRRLQPPEVADPIHCKAALQTPADARLVLSESNAGQATLREVLAATPAPRSLSWAIAIGPEGGWTADEEKQFVAAGWRAISLGTQILRAETAAIASVAALQAWLL